LGRLAQDRNTQTGDVVFVSAASGAVGSVVCQIAKLKGHTVIGSAGGAAKCAFVTQIGADHVIDYKLTGDLTEALLQVAPTGIDIYLKTSAASTWRRHSRQPTRLPALRSAE